MTASQEHTMTINQEDAMTTNEQLMNEQPSTAPAPTYYPSPPGPGPWAPQPPPKPKPGRGLAIAALVLGIVGALFGLIPLTFWMALLLGAVGLIFGIIGRRWGMGKAGAILSTIAVGLGVWGAVIVNGAVNDLNTDLNSGQQGGVSQGIGARDASRDVQLGQLQVDRSYGMTDYSVPVTVTNNSSERSDYWITIALESADGSRQIDTADVVISNLDPGQTRHDSGDFFSAQNVPQNARLVLQQVERTASV